MKPASACNDEIESERKKRIGEREGGLRMKLMRKREREKKGEEEVKKRREGDSMIEGEEERRQGMEEKK